MLAHGTLLATRQRADAPLRVIDLRTGATRWRLPAGIVTGDPLVHQDGALLTWFDTETGARVGSATLQQRARFSLVGTSQDASRAVLARTQTPFDHVRDRVAGCRPPADREARRQRLVVRRPARVEALPDQDAERRLPGAAVRPRDGQARARAPLKDPGESATISGLPFARVASTDGRYLFTLYLGSGGGAMIHELDLVAGTARCVDLPGDGDFDAAMTWALVVDPDGRTLWAVSPGYGRVVAVDIAAHRIRDSYSFQRASLGRESPASR